LSCEFAEAILGNVDIAKGHFGKPANSKENPWMSHDGVQNHMALDALFIVFLFLVV
jgi:hypothetical protein